jgi:hypothetical protein
LWLTVSEKCQREILLLRIKATYRQWPML